MISFAARTHTIFEKASPTAFSRGVPPTNGRFRNLMR